MEHINESVMRPVSRKRNPLHDEMPRSSFRKVKRNSQQNVLSKSASRKRKQNPLQDNLPKPPKENISLTNENEITHGRKEDRKRSRLARDEDLEDVSSKSPLLVRDETCLADSSKSSGEVRDEDTLDSSSKLSGEFRGEEPLDSSDKLSRLLRDEESEDSSGESSGEVGDEDALDCLGELFGLRKDEESVDSSSESSGLLRVEEYVDSSDKSSKMVCVEGSEESSSESSEEVCDEETLGSSGELYGLHEPYGWVRNKETLNSCQSYGWIRNEGKVDKVDTSSELSIGQSMDLPEGTSFPVMVPYKHLIKKEITDMTVIAPSDLIVGYVCLGRYDMEIIEAFKKECDQSLILWGENLSDNAKKAISLEDLIEESDVIMWYADNVQASKDLFYKHLAFCNKLSGKCLINLTNSDPEDSLHMHDTAKDEGADYLEARVLRMPNKAKVNIYSSGGIKAFDAGAMLFKTISYRTFYCGQDPRTASKLFTLFYVYKAMTISSLCKACELIRSSINYQHSVQDDSTDVPSEGLTEITTSKCSPVQSCVSNDSDSLGNSEEITLRTLAEDMDSLTLSSETLKPRRVKFTTLAMAANRFISKWAVHTDLKYEEATNQENIKSDE